MATLEAQLRRAEANFLHVLDAWPDALVVHRNSRIVYVNPAALKLFGYSKADVLGRSPFDFVSPRFRLLVAERILQTYVRRALASEVEERLIHASGREVPVEVVAMPILFEGSLATLVHIRDISVRKDLETKLRAADRLANVGLVAASFAHEVNNPLTYASWNLDLLHDRLRDDIGGAGDLDEIRALIEAARDGVDRAARVARDVKTFSSPEREGSGFVDIHRILDSCANLVRGDMRGRVRLVKHYGEVPFVHGNETRLAQIFLNLIANAVQAMPEDGRHPHEVTLSTVAEDGHVVVSVHDNGTGIPPELREVIFEPFFTTKQHGSGLGLSICRALVGEEHGALKLESDAEHGTTFRVTLPAASAATAPETAPETETVTPRTHTRGKRVLVVDDEPRLATMLSMILEAHTTTIVRNGREAVEKLRAGERYDVVLCDVVMDDVDGIELYEHVRREWPALEHRIVFLTGASATPRVRAFFASIPNPRLEKPFEAERLLDVVDEVAST